MKLGLAKTIRHLVRIKLNSKGPLVNTLALFYMNICLRFNFFKYMQVLVSVCLFSFGFRPLPLPPPPPSSSSLRNSFSPKMPDKKRGPPYFPPSLLLPHSAIFLPFLLYPPFSRRRNDLLVLTATKNRITKIIFQLSMFNWRYQFENKERGIHVPMVGRAHETHKGKS